jgi:nicotinamide phosphoribosyltransferase
MLTVHNTHPDFFWLVNYIESVMSCYLWKSCTSATTAKYYHDLLSKYAEETTGDTSFVPFQAHDFSFRGMASPQDAAISGAAHLQYFKGTDSVLAIDLLEQYYGKDCTKELIGCSVPATEHSVMCMGTEEGEVETFKRLITELYPSGIVSIVSDTWDFWQVISEYTKRLKDDILARDGKVVFRPDSGDPVKIICGDPTAPEGTLEHKGAVEVLWEEFGGEITKQGYKVLDSHVGLIYGDSITPEVAKSMLEALRAKGYASTNIVLGVGSFTYQYVTRDTYGFAVKATYGEVDGVGREIYKDPKTDSGMKKSAKGLLHVRNEGGELVLVDRHTSLEDSGELKTVYKDGVIYV